VVVTRLRLRDFRTYASAEIALGEGLTVVHGANGAGKTNLLEGLYFGCTGRSCRTTNEREVLRFDAAPGAAVRVAVEGRDADGDHELSVGFRPAEPKRLKADGAPVERLLDVAARPLVSVFLPDRLELVKGPPGLRRSHLDQLVAALWPARVATRRAYAQALAQRNALLARLRAGAGTPTAVAAWDLELARHGLALRDDRARAVELLTAPFAAAAGELGLRGDVELRYRPRTQAATPEAFAAELAERLDSDLERGFTGHGPPPRRAGASARRPRAARLRLPGRAAPRAAGAHPGRAGGLGRRARRAAAPAARRRHERARRRPPRAADRAPG
jgi:DNA replication and repair protein RecF